ncbi:MAG: UMP kinase [Clostridiales bacterium]|jgi:uridylate kinase|nr:UMP kinase [Clostridiales bacterium]
MRRAVLKLSGEALAEDTGEAFSDAIIDDIAGQLNEIRSLFSGIELSLVVGGGNFWRGRSSKPFLDRTRSDQIGMLGTVMNGLYLAERFKLSGLQSRVMTPFVVSTFTELFSKEKALDYMKSGEIVIHAGGTGHPFFSTDSISALRAAELDADCVFYAKKVDGIYDCNPDDNVNAKKFRRLTYSRIFKDQLNALDIAAMCISQEAGTDSFVFGLNEPHSIVRAFKAADSMSETLGTKISVACKENYYV